MVSRLVIIKIKLNPMKKNSIIIIFLVLPLFLFSQETLTGMIMDKNNPKDNLGVFWSQCLLAKYLYRYYN